jgi:hypothetical protein
LEQGGGPSPEVRCPVDLGPWTLDLGPRTWQRSSSITSP